MKQGDSQQTTRRLPTTDEWERSWQKHWSKVGMPGYELPVGGPGDSRKEAVDLILRSLPSALRKRLKPVCCTNS